MTENITLPNTSPGSKYLIFAADNWNNQLETNETNNIYPRKIEITDVDVNLGISATAPKTVSLGQSIELSWKVNNSGFEAANGDWNDRIYFSKDEIFARDDDRRLTSQNINSETPLAAGESYSKKVNLSVARINSVTDLGSGYLFFVTDEDNDQGESNETDNIATVPIEVVAPDLTIEADVPSEPIYSNSNNIPLSWTVTNSGKGTAVSSNLYDRVYLSTDEIYDDNDEQIANFDPDNHLPLAPGEDYTAKATGSIGDVTLGNYHLLFVTDADRFQGEADETNNVSSIPIKILAAAPDLSVSNVVAPDSLIIGETFKVKWTVDNIGTTSSSINSWNDRVYISDDPVFDEDEDRELTSFSTSSKTPIASGASYQPQDNSISNDIILPDVGTGSRYLLFVTDSNDDQVEVDETNNVKAVSIEVTAPNLTITDTIVPESARLNETIDLEWTVKNTGTAKTTASDWNDRIYLSDDKIVDDGDNELASSQNSYSSGDTPVFAGKNYTSSTEITIPNTETGSRYLLFVTDEGESQGESNELDNIVSVPIELVAPEVDLATVGTSVPKIVSPNQNAVPISWTVENLGTASADADWNDYVYFSEDAVYDPDEDEELKNININSQTPLDGNNDFYTINTDVDLPNTTAGTKYLIFVSDRDNNQSELDEANNTVIVPLEFKLPNLKVIDVEAPDTVHTKQSVSVEWTVNNDGDIGVSNDRIDRIYLSADNLYDSEDEELDSEDFSDYLQVGKNERRSLNFNLSDDIEPGDYHLLVVTDDNESLAETNENDNVYAHPISIIDAPDLVVTKATVTESSFTHNDEFELDWTVTNQGSIPTSTESWVDYIYFSTDNIFDDDDTYLTAKRVNNESESLAVDKSIENSLNFDVPTDISEENKYILFVADRYGSETTPDGISNVRAVPIEVKAPNLKPSELEVSKATPMVGETISVNWTVTNESELAIADDDDWYECDSFSLNLFS